MSKPTSVAQIQPVDLQIFSSIAQIINRIYFKLLVYSKQFFNLADALKINHLCFFQKSPIKTWQKVKTLLSYQNLALRVFNFILSLEPL